MELFLITNQVMGFFISGVNLSERPKSPSSWITGLHKHDAHFDLGSPQPTDWLRCEPVCLHGEVVYGSISYALRCRRSKIQLPVRNSGFHSFKIGKWLAIEDGSGTLSILLKIAHRAVGRYDELVAVSTSDQRSPGRFQSRPFQTKSHQPPESWVSWRS